MYQPVPKEIINAAARMLAEYVAGLTPEKLSEAITYQPEPEAEHFFTHREAAARLRISTVTVDRMLRSGELPKRRIRGSVRVPSSAVEAMLRGEGGRA